MKTAATADFATLAFSKALNYVALDADISEQFADGRINSDELIFLSKEIRRFRPEGVELIDLLRERIREYGSIN